MAEPQNDSTLKWIFRQLMGEGIQRVMDEVNPPPAPPSTPTIGPRYKSIHEKINQFVRDPTLMLREKAHELAGTENVLPTDALALLQQDYSPEGANPVNKAITMGPIPRDWARRFAAEGASMIRAHPGAQISPGTMDIVADMFERHPETAGQITNIGAILDPNIMGRYSRIPIRPDKREEWEEALTKVLRRDPTTGQPAWDQFIQTVAPNLSEEELVRAVHGAMGNEFLFNPVALDAHPQGPAGAYRTVRHEFQHGLEDLQRRLPPNTGPLDQSYWIRPHEVRARAAENNYGRDMGPRTSHGKPFALRTQQPKGRLIGYNELISRELDAGLREVESGLHASHLPMPANFEDALQDAVDILFRGPKPQFKEPKKGIFTPKHWESYFR